jgi:AraC-like DNA-binding protein/mannose-6-phosphate isomerase-like protein (cupin superfamily)
MKPLLENIVAKKGQQAFMAFAVHPPKFGFFWHYHLEYELTLIIKGKGRRLIGDSHQNFENGDLVLIGPGLPHTWVSDSSINENSEAVVIQFSAHFIERFEGLDELSAVNKLLLLAKQGLVFHEKNADAAKEQIKQLPEKKGVEKITSLLHILNELSTLAAAPLASTFYQPLKGKENENRINKVCQYVQMHAAEPLTIHKAAALINLSPGAFCKFFKRITGITFSDYVNDIRIANVCSQLMATDKQVAEIAYENGFETLTYFNRVFLKKKKMRPSSYRKL